MATLCCQGRAEGLGWGLSAHSKNPLSPMPTPKNKKQEGGSNYVKKEKKKEREQLKTSRKIMDGGCHVEKSLRRQNDCLAT